MNMNADGMIFRLILTLSLLTLPQITHAEWSGGIEGGTVLTGGDKGTKLRLKISNDERPFSQQFYADWIRGESNSNSYVAGYKPKFWFTEQAYAFGEASLKTAKSLQIEQQRNLLAGVGYQLINTETSQFFAEVGAGQTATEFDNTLPGANSSVESTYTLGRIGATQILSDLIKLELDADYSTSDALEQTTAEAGVSLRVAGGAVKYSYRLRSNTIGDADAVQVTDSAISFKYNF